MTEEQARQLGQLLVNFFNLKTVDQNFIDGKMLYNTDYGRKTLEGIGRSVRRLVDEQTADAFNADCG